MLHSGVSTLHVTRRLCQHSDVPGRRPELPAASDPSDQLRASVYFGCIYIYICIKKCCVKIIKSAYRVNKTRVLRKSPVSDVSAVPR